MKLKNTKAPEGISDTIVKESSRLRHDPTCNSCDVIVVLQTTHVADRLVDLIVESSRRLGVDGVDLVQEEGCGWKNFR